MYGIKIKDAYIDLNRESSLTYEINSPLNFGSDIDAIRNGLVYSFAVPNTDKNAELLNHPADVQRRKDFIKDQFCEIVADGTTLFQGLLSVTEATFKSISVSVKISTIPGLTTTDLITVMDTYSSATAALTLMKDSANNPLSYPFIFYPVFNTELNNGEDAVLVTHQIAQNFYDIGTDAFVNDSPQTPFLRLEHVLNRIFTYFGYDLRNDWMTTDELKKLTLYNNYDARVSGNVVSFFDFKNHVPNIKVSDFLKKLCRLFNLAYEVDILNKTARLFPLSDILQTGAMIDWTGKMVKDTVKYSQDRAAITQIRYENPNAHTGKAAYGSIYYENVDYTVDNVETLGILDPNGVYYDRRRDAVYRFIYPNLTLLNKRFDKLKISEGTAWENSIIAPINDVMVFECSVTVSMPNNTRTLYVPYMRVKMSNATEKNDPPMVIIPYRGFQNCLEDTVFPPPIGVTAPPKNYPFASANVWNIRRNLTNANDKTSLFYTDENGLGIRSGLTDLLNFINSKTDVESELLLTPNDLQHFKITKKVRIDNMEYFIKKLTGVIGIKSISRVKAELVTVL